MRLLLIWLFCGFFSVQVTAQGYPKVLDIFTINMAKPADFETQKERLLFGRLLQPQVDGDSLVLNLDKSEKTEREVIPFVYIFYVNEFVELMNRYLKVMEPESRKVVLASFRSRDVGEVILTNYVGFDVEKRGYKLNLTLNEAKDIGISEKIYQRYMSQLDEMNQILESLPEGTKYSLDAQEDKVIGIYFSSDVLRPSSDFELAELLEQDLLELNNAYRD